MEKSQTLERMIEIAREAIQPSPLYQDKSYIQHWADILDGKTRPTRFYQIFPSLENKKRKQDREAFGKSAELCRETYKLVDRIANAESGEGLQQFKNKLIDIEQRFGEIKGFCKTPEVVGELLFQYEDIARQRLAYILETKPEDVRCIRRREGFHYLCECDYAQQFPELSIEVMKKIGDVYRADIKRQETTGKRGMAFYSPGVGIPFSTATDCITALERLGKSLGLNKSEAYGLVGLDEESIERYEKDWHEKAAEHIRKGGLGAEFI